VGLWKSGKISYLLGWNVDTDLLNGLGEFIWLDVTALVEVKEFECFHQNLLFALVSTGLLLQLSQQFSLKTTQKLVTLAQQPNGGESRSPAQDNSLTFILMIT
jgi:hypothetical protein